MRILLLTKADVQGCLNLNQLLPRLLPRHSVRVFLGDCLLPGERGNPAADLMTWHDRDFILEELFPRLDALPPFTAPLLTFQGLSRRYGVPVESLRHGEHHERVEAEVREWRPDLLYCCRYDYILRPEVLERVPSAFNTHSGVLPGCCGPNASFWAMHLGMEETHCSIHELSPDIDAGNVIVRERVRVHYGRSLFWNRMRIYRRGLAAFCNLLPEIEAGTRRGVPQDAAGRRYYGFPDAKDYAAFVGSGKQLVDEAGFRRLMGCFLPQGVHLEGLGAVSFPGAP